MFAESWGFAQAAICTITVNEQKKLWQDNHITKELISWNNLLEKRGVRFMFCLLDGVKVIQLGYTVEKKIILLHVKLD